MAKKIADGDRVGHAYDDRAAGTVVVRVGNDTLTEWDDRPGSVFPIPVTDLTDAPKEK